MAPEIEIGEARPDELDRILEVMCEAFEMPYSAAHAIYYADPYLDSRNKFVVRVRGHIVSCLTVVETTCHLGHSIVRMGGIAGVATRIAERRKGYAGLLLTHTSQALAKRGYLLSGLFPYSCDYYRRFGWETCSVIWHCSVPAGALPIYDSRLSMRKAEGGDIDALDHLYCSYSRGRNLHCLRDKKRWQYILNNTREAVVWEAVAGKLAAYLLYDFQHGTAPIPPQSGKLPALRVLEMVAASDDGRRALISYLAARCPAGGIEYGAPWQDLEASGLLDAAIGTDVDGNKLHVERRPGVMVRVLDFGALCRQLRANWGGFKGCVDVIIEDPLLDHGKFVRIVGEGQGEPEIEASFRDDSRMPDENRVAADVRVWSRIAVGALAVPDAVALNLLSASGPRAVELAAQLFPQNVPFLPAPDHF